MLDIRTIAIIFFINSLVATLFMAALWRQSRKQFQGISLWLTSFALLTAAFVLISLRNLIPDIASILIANCCVVAAAFILYLGLERFVACPSSQRHNYIVLAVFVGLFTYFTFFQPDVAIRIILLNLTLMLMFLQSGWLMLHRVGTQLKSLSRATGILCLLYAVVACYRIILVIFTPTPSNFLNMNLWDATGLLISQILTIGLVLVLLLMVNRRTSRNFFDQKEILIRSKVELEIGNRDLTERKRVEAALQESELRYRNLVNNSKNGVAIYEAAADGEDFIIIDFNLAAERIDNIKKVDIIGKSVIQIFPGIKEFGLFDVFQRVWRTGVSERHPLKLYSDERISGWRDYYVYRLPSGEIVAIYEDVTARKQIEEELKKSERRYRDIFENVLLGIFQKIPGGRYISANPTFAKMYGFDTPDELMSRIVNVKNEFYSSPQDYKLIKQQLDSAMVIKDFEAEGKRRDGTKIWLSICIRAVRDDRGKILYYEGTTVDITERKRAEEALQENEEKYRTVLDAIEEAYFELDLAGNLTFCNDYLCSSLSYSQEEMIGTNYRIWIAEEDHEKAYKSFHQAYLTGSFKNIAFLMLRKDGTKTYAECSTTTIRDSKGKVCGFRGVGHDITEHKRAEEALLKSEALLKEAQGVAHIGHWELDPATMIPAWSEEIFHIFGIDPATGEPSFTAHRDLLHPDDWDILNNAVRATSTTGAPFEIEFRFLHPLKGIRWMRAIGRVIRDDKGNISRLFGTAQDITDSKTTEEYLEKSRQELRDLSERLINLREEERTLLAREIHDELGQALTALKMDLSWLSKKLPKGPHGEKTASMLKLVDTTVKTVKRLSTELRPGLLDDLGLVAAMEWQAGEFHERTGIKTELSFEPDDIMVDNEQATALFRIFQEVLTNITRHAAATRIDAYLRERDGVLELSVRDNGKGIEQKMINSSKSLGLIGMRERCHYLGGTVDIRGKQGKGTTVIVNLPTGEVRQ
ncbi:MAG: PAS domain S-box protein [Dehalococcoidia bacterium]